MSGERADMDVRVPSEGLPLTARPDGRIGGSIGRDHLGRGLVAERFGVAQEFVDVPNPI